MIIGTGIDIIEIERIKKAIDRWGDHFVEHIFNKEEIEYARGHKNSYQHFAGRFAAKEAVFKAVGDANMGWKDLTILNDADGKPSCRYQAPGFDKKIFLSISHCKDYAIANAIVTT
jgi:phosphopantetheine--protein transferase-like protein